MRNILREPGCLLNNYIIVRLTRSFLTSCLSKSLARATKHLDHSLGGPTKVYMSVGVILRDGAGSML